MHSTTRRLIGAPVTALAAVLAGCGTNHSAAPSTATTTAMSGMAGMNDMAGMADAPGDGLLAAADGFTLVPGTTSVTAGQPSTYSFRITQPGGATLTSYQVEQTKQLHFYLVRSDLTGFEHLHPTLTADGTWTVTVDPGTAGSYRVFTQFQALTAGKVTPLVLSQPLTVTGPPTSDQPLPAPTSTTETDGYQVTLSGTITSGADSTLTIQVSHDGQPVTDLQPYLGVYAHLTAFHQGDLAFAHLHPTGTVDGDHGGPTLTFHTAFDKPGQYRVFIQFQTTGTLHTAEVTMAAT